MNCVYPCLSDALVQPRCVVPSGRQAYLNSMHTLHEVYMDFVEKYEVARAACRSAPDDWEFVRRLIAFLHYATSALGRAQALLPAECGPGGASPFVDYMLRVYVECAERVSAVVLGYYKHRCAQYTQHIVCGAAFCKENVEKEVRFVAAFQDFCQDLLRVYGAFMTQQQRADIELQVQLCRAAHAALTCNTSNKENEFI